MLEQAYGWLVHSGIRESSGGVARFYRADLQQNAPVSTEITGYAVSALAHLRPYAPKLAECGTAAALASAQYLSREAWSNCDSAFPFEPTSSLAYFFDTGIIVRGLLAAYKATCDEELAARAKDAALSLAFDFLGEGVFHPAIRLPEKQPLEYEPERWSRSPGCYQLKAALAWKETAEVSGGSGHVQLFEDALRMALATHESFLRGGENAGLQDSGGGPDRVMDRLHAYCYFLEGLLAVGGRDECRRALQWGIARVAELLRRISPGFERSDVCAQLLRVRLAAHYLHGLALDEAAAEEEAARVESYRAESDDPRLHGGFWFGRKCGALMPHMNPVSTVFSAQALSLWQDHCAGRWQFEPWQLI